MPIIATRVIVETGVNSDGRTVGVALPSTEYQSKLLETVYGRSGVDPQHLAFVEAHGTGTRVGDPAEATALGSVLGKPRSKPLPIGSVKSNIGHLEPASGIAGLLKAMLALEHNRLPASLHFDTPNPDIPFDELNIDINNRSRVLTETADPRYAGVSNFGFGGTNVHVILTDPPKPKKTSHKKSETARSNMIMLSARCTGALREMARQYGERSDKSSDEELCDLSNATAWQRKRMLERLVVFGDGVEEISAGLKAFAADKAADNLAAGKALADNLKTALVYSGNGSQWVGMGQAAFEKNRPFAVTFQQVDEQFSSIAGWSLIEMLYADDLEEQLKSTVVAQPLLFALQVALTVALRRMGLDFGAVLGHSVGEVAAAWASGALSLKQATKVIYARSEHQESIRGKGLMVAVMMPAKAMQAVLDNDVRYKGIDISAINSSRSITVSGPSDAIRLFAQHAAQNDWPHKLLDIDYPFHNKLIDPIRRDLVAALEGIEPRQTELSYFSTVSGRKVQGEELAARYWWDNVRKPVRFAKAVQAASQEGFRLFLEVGPNPVLRGLSE